MPCQPSIRSLSERAADTQQQNFVDFHKCVNAKGEDFQPCQQFKRAYQALCPSELPHATLRYRQV